MNDIWVLLDDRAGNNSQSLGLGNGLKLPFIEKNISYNNLAKLPNLIINNFLSITTKESSENLKPPYPKIIISAGRKLAIIARNIKRKNPDTKIIQLMWPEIPIKDFDLIVTPAHDKYVASNNIINTIGAIHKITKDNLLKATEEFTSIVQNLPKPYISLIIGGKTKHGNYTEENLSSLIQHVNNIYTKLGGSLLITTSRRTDKKIVDLLKLKLNIPSYIYEYGNEEKNPYIALLAYGDIIIVTGDSISMCSEACYTGKPVYIQSTKDFCSPKHLKFHKNLRELNIAKNIESIDLENIFYEYEPLDEASRIAGYIRYKLFNN